MQLCTLDVEDVYPCSLHRRMVTSQSEGILKSLISLGHQMKWRLLAKI
jgi:hypothetical protein